MFYRYFIIAYLGQVLREDNGLIGKTCVYTYDNAGNILAKTYYPLTAEGVTPSNVISMDTYFYSSSEWGDLLTSYNGHTITYDEIGNPIEYYNGDSYTFVWDGKSLMEAFKGEDEYWFLYNDDGIRILKEKNGITTNYYLNGSQIVAENTESELTVYIYDSEGSPLGMRFRDYFSLNSQWDVYWFEKNLFGDIVVKNAIIKNYQNKHKSEVRISVLRFCVVCIQFRN